MMKKLLYYTADNLDHFSIWVKILHDPFANSRIIRISGRDYKYILTGKEFKVHYKYQFPVDSESRSIVDGGVIKTKCWVIPRTEIIRVCPALQYWDNNKDWLFPVEFCGAFVRPVYINS